MLVIEVDGDTHGSTADYDAQRTSYLEQQGWSVVRFTNSEVMENLEGVLSDMGQCLPLSLTLSPEGERE